MPDVTVEFSEVTFAELESYARTRHDGDPEEAAERLLAAWLARQR